MVSTLYFRRKLDSWRFHLQHHTGPKQEGAKQKGDHETRPEFIEIPGPKQEARIKGPNKRRHTSQ